MLRTVVQVYNIPEQTGLTRVRSMGRSQ